MSDCYRVKLQRGSVAVYPIIEARTTQEARAKANVLAPALLHRRLPWMLERGLSRPGPDVDATIMVFPPMLIHPGAHYSNKRR